MTALLWLIPIALLLGSAALATFVWALKGGQFDDPSGDASRILNSDDYPLSDPAEPSSSRSESREHNA